MYVPSSECGAALVLLLLSCYNDGHLQRAAKLLPATHVEREDASSPQGDVLNFLLYMF